MKQGSKWLAVVFLMLLLTPVVMAQKTKTQKPVKKTVTKPAAKSQQKKTTAPKTESEKPKHEASQDEKKVQDIVAFLQYMLNTIGSSGTSARDKDVLVTESYTKVFRDSKVQIEDDLDENRKVVTNKDVVAYLKDVDFFYEDIAFEFDIEDIKSGTIAGDKIFYKVSLTRNIKGVTADGKKVNNTKPRFIEINLDPKDQDLKIVSIYTNEFNEKESLTNWWNDLSYEWQTIFKRQLNIQDSVSLDAIRNITTIETLDLNNNRYIQSLVPLAQLLNLKSLSVANTSISDLSPIRNLTELKTLDISNTKVIDLSPLKYAANIEVLNIRNTEIADITTIQRFQKLLQLDVSSTLVQDFSPIANLLTLKYLNVSGTSISDLTPLQPLIELNTLNISKTNAADLSVIKGHKKIKYLNTDSTLVKDLNPLNNLDSLTELHANHTQIEALDALKNLKQLRKIFCDQSRVTKEIANAFKNTNGNVLVIYDSKDLKTWWDGLAPIWQSVLRKQIGTTEYPTREELAMLTYIDSINISGNFSINDLEPLRKLQKLKVVRAANTSIHDLSPLDGTRDLRYLDISETPISDIAILVNFKQLRILKADKTKIENLEPLYGLTGLKKLYLDHGFIHDIIAKDFLDRNRNCLIIYKTIHLNRWWKNIPADWKLIFQQQMSGDTTATKENLHKLVEQEMLSFKDTPVKDLSVLNEFVHLKELHFSGTAISDLSFLSNITSLKSLHATNSPLQKTDALKTLINLEDLDISNTPIDDLKMIEELKNTKAFNCSGTQVKKLIALKDYSQLESLDCSNTNVGSLDMINNLPLKTLKCYNTKISHREIETFKKQHPDCNVIYYR
jgi:Leucine-rich repeat (LRR) protein